MLVFRPVSVDELRALARGASLGGSGFAATGAFLETFGLASADDEDAERTLLYLAGLAALLSHGRRLVAVAEASVRDCGDRLGTVPLDSITFGQVSALFAEGRESAALVAAARAELGGLGVEDAWEHPAHQSLLEDADLLWYGPQEWAVLTGDAVPR